MATIYIAQKVCEDGSNFAFHTGNDAKTACREAHKRTGEQHSVMKIEIKKGVSTREIMCALYNHDNDVFVGSKELFYTAPASRGRPSKAEAEPAPTADEDNEFAEFEQAEMGSSEVANAEAWNEDEI